MWIHELKHNDRVIGGMNEEATDKALEFYGLCFQDKCIAPIRGPLKCKLGGRTPIGDTVSPCQ